MAYKVIKHFTDLQDHNYPYYEGDTFPRKGFDVTPERIAELAGSENKQHTPLIEEVKKPAAKKGAKKPAEAKEDGVNAE